MQQIAHPIVVKHQKTLSDYQKEFMIPLQKGPEENFRFEHGGLLVYDCKAAMTSLNRYNLDKNQSQTESPRRISKFLRNELSKAYNSGNSKIDIEAYLRMKSYGPVPSFDPEYVLKVPDDSITLKFNSKFESGNLYKAVKLSDYEYLLFLNSDVGSSAHNHWYYFSVVNPRKTSITFKITNMLKDDRLYNVGMKPAVYSTKQFNENGTL